MIDTSVMTTRELLSLENRVRVKSIDEFVYKYLLLSFGEEDSYDSIISSYYAYRRGLPIYSELMRSYNAFLETLTSSVISLVGIRTPLFYVVLLTKIIESALVSVPQTFTHCFAKGEIDISYYLPQDFLGVQVIMGNGICRHQNSFVSDYLGANGILCDRIVGFARLDNPESLGSSKLNHLLLAIIEDGTYHFLDSYNKQYTFIKDNKLYRIPKTDLWFIPNFEKSEQIFAEPLNYKDTMAYEEYSLNEVSFVRSEVDDFWQRGGSSFFETFKRENMPLLKRIYLLGLLEIGRNEESESRKRAKK